MIQFWSSRQTHINSRKRTKLNAEIEFREKPKETRISLTLTYNHFCTKISKVIRKNWSYDWFSKRDI